MKIRPLIHLCFTELQDALGCSYLASTSRFKEGFLGPSRKKSSPPTVWISCFETRHERQPLSSSPTSFTSVIVAIATIVCSGCNRFCPDPDGYSRNGYKYHTVIRGSVEWNSRCIQNSRLAFAIARNIQSFFNGCLLAVHWNLHSRVAARFTWTSD